MTTQATATTISPSRVNATLLSDDMLARFAARAPEYRSREPFRFRRLPGTARSRLSAPERADGTGRVRPHAGGGGTRTAAPGLLRGADGPGGEHAPLLDRRRGRPVAGRGRVPLHGAQVVRQPDAGLGKRVFGDRQRVGGAALVPAEQPDAAQRAALERGVAALAAQPQCGGEGAVGGVEPLEQRRHVSLTQVSLGQALGGAVRRKERDQIGGQLELPPAQPERFAQPLLPEQHVGDPIAAAGLVGQTRQPGLHALEHAQRIRQLTQFGGARGRPAAVVDRLFPCLGMAEVVREQVERLLERVGTRPFDRAPDRPVQRRPLVRQQALVGHFLREHMLEAIHRIRHHPDLLDDACVLQPFDRTCQIGDPHRVAQDPAGELAPDDRADAKRLPPVGVQAIEARADHRLDAVGQLQPVGRRGDDRLGPLSRHDARFVEDVAHLFEEEGIASGALVQPRRELLRHALHGKHRLHDRERSPGIEWAEIDAERMIPRFRAACQAPGGS